MSGQVERWRNSAREGAQFELDDDGSFHLSPTLLHDLLQRGGFRPVIGAPEAPEQPLTADEIAVIQHVADLWNALCKIVADGPSREGDLAELAGAIHVIQRAVMAQAAARAYPDWLRLLGSDL